jgi:threonine dehydrogenase-like Zn-dependent dehydrogenase
MHRDGGLAESVAVPAAMCFAVDDGCSDDAAAMAQPLAVALHGLRRARVEGASVAVIGVGGIGSFIIAAAKLRGVVPLIAIDISRSRLRTATSLGADHVFDATEPGLRERIRELTNGYGPDVVIEASGAPPSPQLAASLVRAGGRVGLMGMQSAPTELDLFTLAQWEVDIVPSNAHVCAQDLPEALELLATTDFADRVLGDRIALDRLVPDGLVPLTEGTAEGKILIDLAAA